MWVSESGRRAVSLQWPAAILALFASVGTLQSAESQAAQAEFFESKIRPLLVESCYPCHSSDAKVRFANLRLDSREGMLKGGDRGAVIVPGDPDASALIRAVRHQDLQMPPSGKLQENQIAALVQWVEIGAPWPNEQKVAGTSPTGREAKAPTSDHWAWKPVRKAPTPPVQQADWPTHDVDKFVLAKLEAKGLPPAGEADPYRLLRRVSFDLTGLPPTPEDIKAFVNDKSPEAYEQVVDRLLDSSAFGERWARHWLDLTGYADSLGLGRRIPAKEAWRYRDYVIDAFNRDKPYDRFIREQVAGDVLDWETDEQRREQVIATGLLAIGPFALVDADKELLRMDVVDNQINTVGRVFLGLTLGCARCHDHKFDPIPNREYYALAGIFRSTQTLKGRMTGVFSDMNRLPLPESPEELRQRAAGLETFYADIEKATAAHEAVEANKQKLTKKKEALEKSGEDPAELECVEEELKTVEKELGATKKRVQHLEFTKPSPPMAIATADRPEPEKCRINIRGNPHALGEEVPRGFLSIASPNPPPRIAHRRDFRGGYVKSSGRLELGQWLTDPDNPLVARVMVNRIWHHLFGQGLVRTTDNVGTSGEAPSHPELLDHLAARFIEQGWSTKAIIREIVLTRTYRQSSRHNPEAHEVDPDNRLLWRAGRRRLEAEAYRDALLAISGQLDRSAGGPALPLESSDNVNIGYPSALNPKAQLSERALRRRTIYLPIVRKSQLEPLDILNLFDFPDTNQVTGTRSITTVPTQSLYLMNSPFLREQSRLAAGALLEKKGIDDRERLRRFILRALNRPPDEGQIEQALRFIADFEKQPADSAGAPRNIRLEAWARYCHAVLVSNEFLFRA